MECQAEEYVYTKHKDRGIHKLNFSSLTTFVNHEIVNNHKNMYGAKLLYKRYTPLFLEFAEDKKRHEDCTL